METFRRCYLETFQCWLTFGDDGFLKIFCSYPGFPPIRQVSHLLFENGIEQQLSLFSLSVLFQHSCSFLVSRRFSFLRLSVLYLHSMRHAEKLFSISGSFIESLPPFATKTLNTRLFILDIRIHNRSLGLSTKRFLRFRVGGYSSLTISYTI